MELILVRHKSYDHSTIGQIWVDGMLLCKSREYKDRGYHSNMSKDELSTGRVGNSSALPKGRYPVTFTYSMEQNRFLPTIHGIPEFKPTVIHPMNSPFNPDGAIKVGTEEVDECVSNCTEAFSRLMYTLKKAKDDEIFITIQ